VHVFWALRQGLITGQPLQNTLITFFLIINVIFNITGNNNNYFIKITNQTNKEMNSKPDVLKERMKALVGYPADSGNSISYSIQVRALA